MIQLSHIPYFQSDEATITHGDCLDVLPRLPAANVDLVVTDPPYVMKYRGRWDSKTSQIIEGDDDPGWIRPVYTELYRVLKPNTFAVSFYAWPHADLFVGTFKALGFRTVSHRAFVKNVWRL
jgi:site-specific DNA-methyltransferase (adenine-specific)